MGKAWFCGFLAVAVLICGCGSEARKTPTSRANTVKLETSMGTIVIELDKKAAPITVANFLRYVEEGFYDGTIFHRVMHGFMIQGGGFTTEMVQKETRSPIVNEASNGLKNERGTISMARSSDPDSATCQFFINHVDNSPLDYVPNTSSGYAVFGRVIEGMDVVDAIARVQTTTRDGHSNVPVEPVVIKSARVVSQ
ncbi:MAG TPA: peptidyl-prolyl cis-trans isomerase [Phycisphaerales bacterium]|nr:peptidyl-prolyl cis-trans isomerase [Phycisphaerales bacterium]